jgi:hypothetical protein
MQNPCPTTLNVFSPIPSTGRLDAPSEVMISASFDSYSHSHAQQDGGDPARFPRLGISALVSVLG